MWKVVIILAVILILPYQVKAGNNEEESGFRIGININIILDRTDFKSDYTGVGLNSEYIWGNHFSVYGSIGLYDIESAESGWIKTDKQTLSGAEVSIAFRTRLNAGAFKIFPQVGVGAWSWTVGNYFLGMGADIDICCNINFIMTVDYLIIDSDLFVDNSAKSWTSSMCRIGLCFTYNFK